MTYYHCINILILRRGDLSAGNIKKTKYRQKNQKINQTISDISDGAVYETLLEKGAFKSIYDISVILNTDGVPVFNSSSYSFWPVHIYSSMNFLTK